MERSCKSNANQNELAHFFAEMPLILWKDNANRMLFNLFET